MTTIPAPAASAPAAPARSFSALDGWIDVLRVGAFTDSSGEDVSFSAADLAAIANDYTTSDPAPITIGHPDGDDAPAWGWVETLRVAGDRLQARLGRLDEGFRAACEAGRYAPRSVSISRPTQGRGWTLWHVAFLGAAAPAVDGLVPSRFSRARLAPEGALVIDLAAPLGGMEERTGWRAVERVLRGLREWVIERSGIDTADRVLPDWNFADLTALGEVDMEDPARLSGAVTAPCAPRQPGPVHPNDPLPTLARQETDMPGTQTASPPPAPAAADAAQLAAGQTQLEADRRALDADRLAFAAARRLSGARDSIQAHVTAGRVLPAEAGDLTALLAALDEGQQITLAGAETGLPRQTNAAELLESFLAGLPARGPDRSELSAPESAPAGDAVVMCNGYSVRSVTLAAQALMAADPTDTLTIDRAVRQITNGAR